MTFERMITCIDSHTGGEPTRIVTSGFPPIPGNTILEKREYVLKHYDHIRTMLMFEPRGHAGMYGCIIVPPVTDDGDIGVLFTHNEGLSTMCGHATIGITTVVFQTGMVESHPGENVLKIDSPAGRITAYASVKDGKVENVRFANVPSFVLKEDIVVDVDGIGPVLCDVGFCGAFYVYVDAQKIGVALRTENVEELVKKGMEIKYKVMENMEIVHPLEPGLNGIYGTIITDPVARHGNVLKSKNICIFAEGQIDRSPTGTGTGGRVALCSRKGIMGDNDTLENLSIIDTKMTGRIINHTQVAGISAVVPEVSGRAFITGFNQLVLDPEDPIPAGFRLIGG